MYAQPSQYTIKSGDTFDAIAAMKGTTAKVLEALNPGMVPTDLGIGTVMNLPSQGTFPPSQQQQPFPAGQQQPVPFSSQEAGQQQMQSQQVRSLFTLVNCKCMR
jgi:LysM repeat protein